MCQTAAERIENKINVNQHELSTAIDIPVVPLCLVKKSDKGRIRQLKVKVWRVLKSPRFTWTQ